MADIVARGLAGRLTKALGRKGRFTQKANIPASITGLPCYPDSLEFMVDPVTGTAFATRTQESIYQQMTNGGYSAPVNSFYVDMINGNDNNSGLSWASAFMNGSKAVQAANATGQNAAINVLNGGPAYEYGRAYNFYGAGAAVRQTVNILYVAHGGIVDMSTHENGAKAWTAVNGYPGVYTLAVSNISNVAQRILLPNSPVCWVAPEVVAAATDTYLCPGTMHYDGTTLTVHFFNNVVPTTTNVRVFKQGMPFSIAADVCAFFTGAKSGDGWSFMGGSAAGGFSAWHAAGGAGGGIEYNTQAAGAAPAQYKCLLGRNIITGFGYRGLAVDSLNGVAWFDDCRNMGQVSDFANIRSVRASSRGVFLLTNSKARLNGMAPSVSNQGFTAHDTRMTPVGICNDYDLSAGGHLRHIGGGVGYEGYPTFGFDRGDVPMSGAVRSADVQLDDAGTELWVEYPRFRTPGSEINFRALNGTTIRVKSPSVPYKVQTSGTGQVVEWK